MPYKNPEKARQSALERGKRYRERKKVAKYGSQAAGVNMSGRHGNHARGEKNGRWNGDKLLSSGGYVLVRVPKGHHRGFGPPQLTYQYAYEHDLVMEKKLGRRLADGEEVHHVNEDKQDNRPENLELKTKTEHAKIHSALRGRDALGRFPKRGRQFPRVESAVPTTDE